MYIYLISSPYGFIYPVSYIPIANLFLKIPVYIIPFFIFIYISIYS